MIAMAFLHELSGFGFGLAVVACLALAVWGVFLMVDKHLGGP